MTDTLQTKELNGMNEENENTGRRIVISLGHKDLGSTLPETKEAVKKTAHLIAEFVKQDYQVAVVFSNLPQFDMVHTAMKDLSENYPDTYTKAPLSVCSAMTQGMEGFDIQNALTSELYRRGIPKTASTVITQVVVDPYDEKFYKPVRIFGKKMNAEEARAEEEDGNYVKEAEPGVFRRLVPSPDPKEIVEAPAVNALLDAGQIVIACGGGGVPVIRQGEVLRGASALIDKDLVAGLLADKVNADILLITTAVKQISTNHGKANEKKIKKMTAEDAREYLAAGDFEFESMKPKVEACLKFVESDAHRMAIVTSMEFAEKAIDGLAGTIITKEQDV